MCPVLTGKTHIMPIITDYYGNYLRGFARKITANKYYSFCHAPRREPNSSPRHEDAGLPSTLEGGGLV